MTNKIQRLAKVSAVALSTFGLVANTAFAQTLPAGTNGDTLRHNGTNWITSTEFKNYGINGVVATGTFGSGNIPAQGTGTRMMWYPAKAAFRAGYVANTQWDDINIGKYSVALGQSNIASGDVSFNYGVVNTTTDDFTTAFGFNNSISERFGVGFGHGNQITGLFGFGVGQANVVSGEYATAYGYANTSSGRHATVFGKGNKAQAYHVTAFGKYNVGGGNPTTWVATDPLFEIGDGVSDLARSNAFTILKNGNIGIGTHTPSNKLEVVGSSKFGGEVEVSGGLNVRSGEINLRPYTNMLAKATPACDGNKVGTISFHNDAFWGCTSKGWTSMNMNVVK